MPLPWLLFTSRCYNLEHHMLLAPLHSTHTANHRLHRCPTPSIYSTAKGSVSVCLFFISRRLWVRKTKNKKWVFLDFTFKGETCVSAKLREALCTHCEMPISRAPKVRTAMPLKVTVAARMCILQRALPSVSQLTPRCKRSVTDSAILLFKVLVAVWTREGLKRS